MKLVELSDTLEHELASVTFTLPVANVYQPLRYAREPHVQYLEKFGAKTPREIILVGMNPGPWGMAQTGVPFGEVNAVRDWMGIEGPVGQPVNMHPARPVDGFMCKRKEASGARLWGWAQDRFGPAENFFERFFVHNYCPLLFLNESGSNRTPPQIRKVERDQVLAPCDKALRGVVEYLQPKYVIGVGNYAEKRIQAALGSEFKGVIGRILHPSPASPAANRGWAEQAEAEMRALGIDLSS